MQYLRLNRNNDSKQVMLLCELLGTDIVGVFDEEIDKLVRNFQKENNLSVDGIVGPLTWLRLFESGRLRKNNSKDILDSDYDWAAMFLDCEPAALKAVVKVETGNKEGFVAPNKPVILFEGHIFWKQLSKIGKDPKELSKGNENILYSSWTKKYYLGGEKEYERFDKACKIDKDSAIQSTSFGLFQIMGFNYKLCSCINPEEFYNRMCYSEFKQFVLGIEFIRNSGCQPALSSKNWAEFAKKYNGPEYKQNNYDTKLEKAYNEFKS